MEALWYGCELLSSLYVVIFEVCNIICELKGAKGFRHGACK
jgi:hypothetical protein